ncbi:hypothetical protein [Pseudogemmobacter faecipullorum]|uniref:Translation initiation factor 2 n=1 Tax=Pseudogemmobacter faecipullorum TaxID=2755041 RepID=A0ABS8CG84_9RHOB|nr:hypothetical protein [Pseudogemmobacter faecipullorum]MCB5408400.1 hypothetical protein [Pseudogemmobacter faecipullorum]
MKPNFALNFTDTSIALLHRTARGWLKVGETPFDASDLDEALAKMRKTALGLEPGGFTTKLVLPPSQILYSELAVAGGTEEETRAEISAELERRTPYKADEVVFDWHIVTPRSVKVAAVARETLEEAEGFATSYEFNPLGFVAVPEEEQFDGEPWFGVTAAAAELLPEGENPERDHAPIALLDTTNRARSKARAASEAEPEAEAEAETVVKAEEIKAETAAPAVSAAEPEEEKPLAKADPSPAPVAPATAAPATTPLASEPLAPRAAAPVQPQADADVDADHQAEPAPGTSPAREAAASAADLRPAGDLAAKSAPLPEAVVAAPAAKVATPPAAAPAVSAAVAPVTRPTAPEITAPAVTAAIAAAPVAATPLAPAPLSPAPLSPATETEEAPFAHVADSDTGAELPAAPPSPRQGGSGPRIHRPAAPEDDLPPAPSGPVMAAYNRSRSDERALPQARAAAPRLAAAPVAEPRPAAPAKPSVARGLSGLVTAPSIPGTRKTKARPAATPVAPAAGPAHEAARSLSTSPFSGPPPKRKSRHMALILTLVLLLCLALVAAWSSFYLASDQTAEREVQLASPAAPVVTDPDDEGESDLAFAGETGAAALESPQAAEAMTAEAAPEARQDSPAAVALLDGEDEIFLSSADVPPPAFDALSLPAPEASAEAPPGNPMPPPPFGTVYRFDENGLLVPTAVGIPAPGGFMLYEGKPPRVPPARSAVATAAAGAAAAARQAEAEAAAEAEATAQAETATAATAPAAGNPSLLPAAPVAEAPAEAPAAEPVAQPDPELADRRPRTRPAGVSPDDDAALSTEAETATAALDAPWLRPRARPESIIASAATARAETASASLVDPDAVVQLASAAAPNGISITDAANPSLLTISRRPAAKPDNFSAAVEAAVAAAVRAPEPPAATPEPAPKNGGKSTASADELDEIDEPQLASAPAPRIPTRASVAKQATFTKAINLSKINLIGVYGTPSNRYALVRLANGKFRKVGVGDKIDGGQVRAITQNELRYQKGGRLLALPMPKG